jgi:hypothetical protein
LLNEHFVPVAIDINYTQYQKDAEGRLFRKIVEQGHYAGRTKPTNTRQGLYIATVDGTLLSSINTTTPRYVVGIINKALAKSEATAGQPIEKFAEENKPDPNFSVEFPEGGMILRETMRDLPRSDEPQHETWRHNFDYVWLTSKEVASFIPSSPIVGQTYQIPESFVNRFARFHLVDQVKGESPAWDRSAVKLANLNGEVTSVDGDRITVRLRGKARCTEAPSGEVNPFTNQKVDQDRGIDLQIRGWLVFDRSTKSFVTFELLATGNRWGTTTYNFRQRDLGPAAIGFVFEMLPPTAENKTRPKFVKWGYFQ